MATSKSTTVNNYWITSDLVECIYDTAIKQNKPPGVHIPVLPYEEFHASNPDYVFYMLGIMLKKLWRKRRNIWAIQNTGLHIPSVR